MKSKNRKRLLLVASLFLFMLIAAGCSTSAVNSSSTGIWDHYIIYNFSRFLLWLADLFGGSYGWAIVAFTLIIRIIILPLTWWQSKSMLKQQEVAPEIQALQKKYAAKDTETQQKLREETQKLYAEAGVNPVVGCLPLVVQMPVLIALYQAIYRTAALKSGTFLWMELGKADPYFIMAILAAIFTFGTSYLTMLSQPTKNAASSAMLWVMPVMIFVMAMNIASAVSIYWVVTNAFSVAQTMVIQNPFKIRRDRAAKEQDKRDREKAIAKARKKATRKR
ncbi:membrane protein insertase YidC [Latilactobacillus fuchuensis]|uniref:Membrane protein insertase YidC n=2 Tax=Latilactobacillus fuchuensis TaxID=164393 RepID=A0A2N9DSU0_9LACO|nr:membrane protein insertase YidC [Latilactobacillus fuchuensis]KRL61942.1 membrane insertase, YidC Oxa1 family domain protein [Latilactobacillus fuchuensis DSM 14340 = JCM 11249]MCP8856742.1 membrane protein insertase YidC [Latilactobacillus fuchuensis]SPC35827.1 Sec-independent factor for membrane protein insertion (YidC/SpoIIIJ family) [Latilactobacillus fuchuensis]